MPCQGHCYRRHYRRRHVFDAGFIWTIPYHLPCDAVSDRASRRVIEQADVFGVQLLWVGWLWHALEHAGVFDNTLLCATGTHAKLAY